MEFLKSRYMHLEYTRKTIHGLMPYRGPCELGFALLSRRPAGRPIRSSPQGLAWRGNTGESSR